MTMIVVCFDAAPSIDKEKVASEATWKAQMLAAINGGLISQSDSTQHELCMVQKALWLASSVSAAPVRA